MSDSSLTPYFGAALIDELQQKKDVLVFEKKRNPTVKPLFEICSNDQALYNKIIKSFTSTTTNRIKKYLYDLLKQKFECPIFKRNPSCVDFTVDNGMEKHLIALKSKSCLKDFKSINSLKNIQQGFDESGNIKDENYTYFNAFVHVIFMIEDDIESYNAINELKYKTDVMNNINFEICTFEEFLNNMFGPDEKYEFHESMIYFKKQVSTIVGYQITELCTPENWQKFVKELQNEIFTFRFDQIEKTANREIQANNEAGKEQFSPLSSNSYKSIKYMFFNEGRYKLLLKDSNDFATSFMSSEWFYKKYAFNKRIDNTSTVAGYFKSIEQLLWCFISTHGRGRKIAGKIINDDNLKELHATLGSLTTFLKNAENSDIFSNSFNKDKQAVISFFNYQIREWTKKERNGYFHKDNLHDPKKLEKIRNDSWFLLMLILGSLAFTQSEIESLGENCL